ncbi:hypothetical protein [Bradyrhizobium genosp. L]|uniref:hypothetical protein n=1 Tax=Bradyrhizobium genosp. L TaxID=83637 RepID=UPI001FEE1047|nr:hypothetical protein [Bradyrhizobium genosp. L]
MKSFDQSVGVVAEGCAEAAQQPALIQTGELRVIPAQPGASGQPRAEVLPFPLHGEALLVKLADALRRRVAGRQPDHNPLCLTILRTPRVRLSIDGSAYVDYLSELSVYQAAIDATPDTKVILKTTDFDALASFVVQYVDDRLIERSSSKETAP